jgi:hypothetical protein
MSLHTLSLHTLSLRTTFAEHRRSRARRRGGQLRGGPGRAVHDVGHPETVVEQRHVLLGPHQPRREARPVDGRPEPVARPGEVVPARGRRQRRVDAAEEDVEAGGDHVAQRLPRHGPRLTGNGTRPTGNGARPTGHGAHWPA